MVFRFIIFLKRAQSKHLKVNRWQKLVQVIPILRDQFTNICNCEYLNINICNI
jgi:hypothetical protein